MKRLIKSYVSGYFPACDGVVKKPLPCLLAARDGAKPSIFCIFCQTDNVFVSLSIISARTTTIFDMKLVDYDFRLYCSWLVTKSSIV